MVLSQNNDRNHSVVVLVIVGSLGLSLIVLLVGIIILLVMRRAIPTEAWAALTGVIAGLVGMLAQTKSGTGDSTTPADLTTAGLDLSGLGKVVEGIVRTAVADAVMSQSSTVVYNGVPSTPSPSEQPPLVPVTVSSPRPSPTPVS